MKRIAVFYNEYTPTIDAIKYKLSDILVVENPSETEDFDLYIRCHYTKPLAVNALEIHYSLLPAFNSGTPLKDAFLYGAQVTGITIYYTQTNQIILQYPVLIESGAHYDDIKLQLQYLEQALYPLVIEKILANETIDIKNLFFKNPCSSACGGSCGCKK